MSERDKAVLAALVRMVDQYLTVGEELDTLSMSAGQNALRILADAGLVDYDGGRCGTWTQAGRDQITRS
ncbi:MAG: hypothetical protein KKE42_16135 [Alphaproteobacteria bacterium]|uniref:hypothetical protein n=1 Tax=Brevundimonas sp. TaxID=1871086 RepID=UPI0017E70E37|nr:hypothetical protein [Brevundimonas sp.]MBU3971692.1 hypothetical protein [Alphaproteobacteria bacterium]MBA3050691.1 hypothetical protein [Brevundimonas sp.]MBU3975317.1 hypothetical protein [Alphaproteobacteria bacterium]MBU4039944.1 hypothetical protein [Alphaproteobacteria bacterium]MBU4134950.1 hypothetical protein [Alphaproteobacteria bacterium]